MADVDEIDDSAGSSSNVSISENECLYAACYCEENVWQMCSQLASKHGPSALDVFSVVFISNEHRTTPLWCQKAGDRAHDGLVVWDYHVILVEHCTSRGTFVYDLDTTLAFPSSFDHYFTRALRSDSQVHPQMKRMFRVVDAAYFLRNFSSDRAHMRDAGGKWMAEPPAWPAIKSEDAANNLAEFWSMTAPEPGRLVTSSELLELFSLSTSGNVM